jgi:biopolymer transport protein ExbD
MASLAGVPTRGSGRRPLDAALNVVPFIDLLSCCIAFLLITAVWSSVARVDVSAGGAGGSTVEGPPPWTLHLDPDGWTLRAPDGVRAAARPDELAAMLRARAVPEPLLVRAADGVPYATLVDALDRVRAAGVRVVSVSGEGD